MKRVPDELLTSTKELLKYFQISYRHVGTLKTEVCQRESLIDRSCVVAHRLPILAGSRHPEITLGPPGEFETCPDWPPRVHGPTDFMWKVIDPKANDWFEWTGFTPQEFETYRVRGARSVYLPSTTSSPASINWTRALETLPTQSVRSSRSMVRI